MSRHIALWIALPPLPTIWRRCGPSRYGRYCSWDGESPVSTPPRSPVFFCTPRGEWQPRRWRESMNYRALHSAAGRRDFEYKTTLHHGVGHRLVFSICFVFSSSGASFARLYLLGLLHVGGRLNGYGMDMEWIYTVTWWGLQMGCFRQPGKKGVRVGPLPPSPRQSHYFADCNLLWTLAIAYSAPYNTP